MIGKEENIAWLTSGEARKLMQISTCELAHLRTAGQLQFQKRGNAYLYSAEDCRRIATEENRGPSVTCVE